MELWRGLQQQMWPEQGWRGAAGGAALRLAAGPGDVAGPGLEVRTSPGLWVRRLWEASCIPRAGTGAPGSLSAPQPAPPGLGPGLLEGACVR